MILQGTDARAPHWPLQVPWVQASRHGGELAADSGKVCSGGEGGIGQGVLQDGTALQWLGGEDLGGYPCGAAPVEETRPGGVLGVPHH